MMVADKQELHRTFVLRSKYQNLYKHLCSLQVQVWRTCFSEIEAILGFALPPSARLHRPWWSNQRGNNGHSHALAWRTAGWETAEVNMDAETLAFRRILPGPVRTLSLDEVWPVHPTLVWPEGLSLRREDLYDYRM